MKQYDLTGKDWLDLLFEHRNKSYGAYELRHHYGQRLLLALGAGLAFAASLLFLIKEGKPHQEQIQLPPSKEMVIREYKMPVEKKVIPPVATAPQKARPKKTSVAATKKYVSRIEIKKDELVKNAPAAVSELQEKEIGETDQPGTPANGASVATEPAGHENGNGKEQEQEPAGNFQAIEIAPEFPGGPAALHRFLARNCVHPMNWNPGIKDW